MTKPRHSTTAERIRHTLEAEIGSGVWLPGQALDEQALSERFQVSRTPVREALLQLSALGYLDVVPRAGIFVRTLSQEEADSMFEALACLEGLCAGLAAERLSAAQGRRLERLHQQALQAASRQIPAAYERANQQFHDVLYASTGNQYLAEQVAQIRRRTYAYRLMQFDQTNRAQQSLQEHQRILEHVLRGDAQAASVAAIEHIAQGRQDFSRFVSRCTDGLFTSRQQQPRRLRPSSRPNLQPNSLTAARQVLMRPLWPH